MARGSYTSGGGSVLRRTESGLVVPYSSPVTALADAGAYDHITCYGGRYDVKNLLKPNVSWTFHGTVITYTGPAGGGIFDDSAGTGCNAAVTCTIDGTGTFINGGSTVTPVPDRAVVFNLTNAATSIKARAWDVGSAPWAAVNLEGGATLDLDCRRVYATANHGPGFQVASSTLRLTADLIDAGYCGDATGASTVTVHARDTIVRSDSSLNAEGTTVMRFSGETMTMVCGNPTTCGGILAMDSASLTIVGLTVQNNGGYALGFGVSSGTTRAVGCRLVSAYANTEALWVGSSGTSILEDCTLVAHSGATNGATGTGTVKVYGSCRSNKAIPGTVTQHVGTIVESANVV